jgi:hypothetical protein
MPDTPYLGQDTDLILGREFLTWLWFASDTRNGMFRMPDTAEFALFMEQRISVQGGEGENLETATVSGALSPLREARLGLITGKKVTRALVRLEQDADVWRCVLKAGDFSLNSLRTPRIDRKDGTDQDSVEPDAALLEKVFLMEKATAFLDELYSQFLCLRLSPTAWKEESARIRTWIHQDI